MFIYKVDYEHSTHEAVEAQNKDINILKQVPDSLGQTEKWMQERMEKQMETRRDTMHVELDNPWGQGFPAIFKRYIGDPGEMDLFIHSIEYVCQPLTVED